MEVQVLSRVQWLWRRQRSRVSYARRGGFDTRGSHTRARGQAGRHQLDTLEIAGSIPAERTGASPKGRAAVLQTADGSSILSDPTLLA
jgi:hypothetical protein